MTYDEIVRIINPEIHCNLKRAIELGKWPNGIALTQEQKEICIRAIIYYESKSNLPDDQRIGFIDTSKKKSPCGTSDTADNNSGGQIEPVRIVH
jgi:uncharacterized protein YeaC (DUF1315 family)